MHAATCLLYRSETDLRQIDDVDVGEIAGAGGFELKVLFFSGAT